MDNGRALLGAVAGHVARGPRPVTTAGNEGVVELLCRVLVLFIVGSLASLLFIVLIVGELVVLAVLSLAWALLPTRWTTIPQTQGSDDDEDNERKQDKVVE